jgi:methylated-DNA-[protein]-cysteine S-methyltransferase
VREFREYFSGGRQSFDLPLGLVGTGFERRVLRRLLAIPFGKTMTYGEVARSIGSPRAARAVGNAVRKNPLAILVPCHRVVPAGRGIGRYASGTWRKRWLLRHEASYGGC